MLNVYEQHSKRKLVAIILSIIVIAGCVVFADNIKSRGLVTASTKSPSNSSSSPTTARTPTSSTDTSSPPTASTSANSSTSSSGYNNGSYTATSSYYVPRSNETIKVNLTLNDEVITAVSIQNSESDNESARYQEDFAAIYKSYVVGQKISSLKLGIIAGASDTTQGFNDALSQIVSKAQT